MPRRWKSPEQIATYGAKEYYSRRGKISPKKLFQIKNLVLRIASVSPDYFYRRLADEETRRFLLEVASENYLHILHAHERELSNELSVNYKDLSSKEKQIADSILYWPKLKLEQRMGQLRKAYAGISEEADLPLISYLNNLKQYFELEQEIEEARKHSKN